MRALCARYVAGTSPVHRLAPHVKLVAALALALALTLVAVATVLAMQPEIVVLDEPSSNLDPAGRCELAEVLAELPVTLLMVTHDLPYAAQLCPRSVILDGGVIAADGPTPEVLSDAGLLAAHRLELPYGFDPTRI